MPSPRSRQLSSDDKKYVWHPFTQMKDWQNDPDPLVIERGKGSLLYDTEGKAYIDAISSLWVTTHGHSHPAIQAAIATQLKKLQHSTLLGLGNIPSIELARELVRISPKGLNKVFYSDSGSTAMEIAMKMAYQAFQNTGETQRRKFITFKEAYHGDTIGSVSLGGIDLFHRVYRKLLFKTRQLPSPYYPLNKGETISSRLKPLETLLKKTHKETAAVILEPLVQGAAGILCAPQGLLKGIRRLTQKYDVLLIADEVATGFGRTGKMFACDHEKVSPDIMAVAKGISGGTLPLAATLVSDAVYNKFVFPYSDMKTFFHGHTYTGNPLACAAALANLKLYKKEKTLQKIHPRIKQFAAGLKNLSQMDHVGETRQWGLMMGIELVANKKSGKPFPWQKAMGVKVCRLARDYGVILRPLGPVIVLMPPFCITQKETKKILDVVKRCISEICR